MDYKTWYKRRSAKGFAIGTFICQIIHALSIIYFDYEFCIMYGLLLIFQILLLIKVLKRLDKNKVAIEDSIIFVKYFAIAQTITGFGIIFLSTNWGWLFEALFGAFIVYAAAFIPGVIILILMVIRTEENEQKHIASLYVLAVLFSIIMQASFLLGISTEYIDDSPDIKSIILSLISIASQVMLCLSYITFLNCAINDNNKTLNDDNEEDNG